MKHDIERNRHILWSEMERLGGRQPLTPEIAARLGVYRDAYKALCMLCDEDEYDAKSEGYEPLTKEAAMAWTSHMKNEDGTTGPHWTMENTEQARKQRNIGCDPLEFYVAMNMIYSDYCKAAEKANASSMDLYAYMAKAFLDDKDAQPNKLERYYNYIAKK